MFQRVSRRILGNFRKVSGDFKGVLGRFKVFKRRWTFLGVSWAFHCGPGVFEEVWWAFWGPFRAFQGITRFLRELSGVVSVGFRGFQKHCGQLQGIFQEHIGISYPRSHLKLSCGSDHIWSFHGVSCEIRALQRRFRKFQQEFHGKRGWKNFYGLQGQGHQHLPKLSWNGS